jgi:hypothetical protein
MFAAAVLAGLPAARASAQTWALDTATGLELHQSVAEAVTFEGRRALRVTLSPAAAKDDARPPNPLVLVTGVELGNGTIEVDVAGAPAPGAAEGARGFVGVAFRVQPDRGRYDAFYLRPTNGRADDQERRNHTTQYVSHPDFPWHRLREETPGRYESYVDIQPATWIHVRIDVAGDRARLYVDGAEQPTLVVNDLKSGASATGQVALWLDGSTVAHFANLRITKR